jgi:hypothetical protein
VGLAVEGGQLDFRGDLWVGDGDVELEGELVAAEVVDVPAGALPAGALRVGGGDAEPVVVLGLVHRRVGDQRAVLLLEPLPPRLAVPGPRAGGEKRDLAHHALRPLVPPLHRRSRGRRTTLAAGSAAAERCGTGRAKKKHGGRCGAWDRRFGLLYG